MGERGLQPSSLLVIHNIFWRNTPPLHIYIYIYIYVCVSWSRLIKTPATYIVLSQRQNACFAGEARERERGG